MVLPRPTALRGFAPARLYRSTARTTIRSRLQTVARRGYASEGGHEHAASSDIPWLISAVAVTLPACYFLWPEASHADAHGAHGEHGEHDEEHEEEHEEGGEEEAKDEPEGEESASEEPKEEDAPADEPKENGDKEEAQESSDDKSEGESKDEQSSGSDSGEGKPDRTEPETVSNQKVDGVKFKGPTSAGDENNEMQDTRKREPDSKGAFKKRIDSKYQTNLGEGPEKVDDGRASAASAKSVSDDTGSVDKKQMGLSNTPTRHSSDITTNPEKSKKGEGIPETAKSMGTVDPRRPPAESADRGKK